MAPLSTRCCNCGPSISFCPPLAVQYRIIGSDTFGEQERVLHQTRDRINQSRNGSYNGMSNTYLVRTDQMYAETTDEIDDAVKRDKNNDDYDGPRVCIFFIGYGFGNDNRQWVNMRAMSLMGYTLIVAPLASAFLTGSQFSVESSGEWSSALQYYPPDPFSPYSGSDDAIALKDDLNEKVQYWLGASFKIELINADYPGYTRTSPRNNPGNFVNPIHYNAQSMFCSNRARKKHSDSSPDELSDVDIRGNDFTASDTTYDFNTNAIQVPTSRVDEGYSGLPAHALSGRHPGLAISDGDQDGIIAYIPSGRYWNPPSAQCIIYDPSSYNPWDYNSYSSFIYGQGFTSRTSHFNVRHIDPSVLYSTYIAADYNHWYLPGEITYQFAPYSTNTTYNSHPTHGINDWQEPTGGGGWTSHKQSDSTAALTRMKGWLQSLANGTLEYMGNMPERNWVGSLISGLGTIEYSSHTWSHPHVRQTDFSYNPPDRYGRHLNSTNIGATIPQKVPSTGLCIGRLQEFHPNDNHFRNPTEYINTSSSLGDTRSSPAIALQYVDGRPVFLWDTQWSLANQQVDSVIAMMAAGDKHPICQRISGQKTSRSQSSPGDDAPKLASSHFNGIRARSSDSRVSPGTKVDYKLTGSAWESGTNPLVFEIHTEDLASQYWSARKTKSYIHTADEPNTGDNDRDKELTAELQDWQAFTIIRTPALPGKGVGAVANVAHPTTWEADGFGFEIGESQEARLARHTRYAKYVHNGKAHAIGWSQWYANYMSTTIPNYGGMTLDNNLGTPYPASSYELDPAYNNCIANLLKASSAVRITTNWGMKGNNFSPWRISGTMDVPVDQLQNPELYFGTVREDGMPFRNFDNSYPSFESNEYETDDETISRRYEKAKGTLIPVLFIDYRQYAAFNIYSFPGGHPETFGMLEDFVDITDYPNHTADPLLISGNEQFLSIGYGIFLDGKDFPLGVNPSSKTRMAPLYGRRESEATAINQTQMQGDIQVELLFDNDALIPNRYANQIRYQEA